ncbi:MAG: biotin--[acetyl-CoA-carboxylase] ligase [Phycisphaeraceae bacterium]|nr:biotin--[acetyl-CoA-carboxylase] ligase [Phycisphaeraceae bacterium]
MSVAQPLRRIDFDEIDSTSLHARRLVEAGSPETEHSQPLVIVAATQTAGVGRLGRAWSSPRGGLWCTFVLRPSRAYAQMSDGLGMRIGAAVTEALRAAAGPEHAPRLQTKWPNDVLLDGRKVCGVLTETAGAGDRLRVLVGVGANIDFSVTDAPEELRERITTMREAFGAADMPTRERVLAELAPRLLAAVNTAV